MDADGAVPLDEKLLVLSAILTSLGLAAWVFVGPGDPGRAEWLSPSLYLVGTLLLTASCLASAVAPLFLMFLNRVSLDATSSALTGLVPAVEVLLTVDLRLLLARAHMRRSRALQANVADFRFLRLGALEKRHNGGQYEHHLFAQPPSGNRQLKCFVVCQMPAPGEVVRKVLSPIATAPSPGQSVSNGLVPEAALNTFSDGANRHWQDANGKIVSNAPPNPEMGTSPMPPSPPLGRVYQQTFWSGAVLPPKGAVVKVVHLEKWTRNHDALRWWRSLLGASSIVAAPDRIYVDTRSAAVNALVLAVDLCVAGDLVLHFFDRYIRGLVRSSRYHEVLNGAAASTCTRFFAEVRLADQWGPINEDTRRYGSTARTGTYGTQPTEATFLRGRKCGILFLLLAESSGLFDLPQAAAGGGLGEELSSLWDSLGTRWAEPDPARGVTDLDRHVYHIIKKWLIRWGAQDLPTDDGHYAWPVPAS